MRFKEFLPLTNVQFIVLSEIARDIAQVFFATLVVPLVFGLDTAAWYVILSGIIGSVTFWLLSIWFVKEGKR